ncbi:MAG: sialate O-acetylesterase [Phycisphaera sp.]|nr:sialate O-acetylesterase [Phycisphaera sp.]
MTVSRIAWTLVALFIVTGTAVSSALSKEVQVFILAGQSNMVGHGKVETGREPNTFEPRKSAKEVKGGLGSLRDMVNKHPDLFGPKGKTPIVDDAGKWLVRSDVFIDCVADNKDVKGQLTTGFGAGQWIGPEFSFGFTVGDAIKDPVLIIKTSWGGKDLCVDFRPPSSTGEPPRKCEPEDVGHYYRLMIETVKKDLANIEKDFPELKGYTPRIVGFGWHQGWNDGGNEAAVNEYEKNMANFIRDVRKDLDAPDMLFVIANTGMVGPDAKGIRAKLCENQLALGDPKKHPEFAGNVAAVETRSFYRPPEMSPSDFGYHWNHNGESHFLVGKAMAEAMLKLIGNDKHRP